MKESAFKFGKYESLVGIISDPFVDPNNRPAVIILNSGLLHGVGPNCLHVKIARKLASVGFVVLRFDLFGIGLARFAVIMSLLKKAAKAKLKRQWIS